MLLETLVAMALAGGWETAGPPASAIVTAAGDGHRLYAIAGSVDRSDDGGQTWRDVLDAPELVYLNGLFADPTDPDRIFASAFHPGFAYFTAYLYFSVDGGETWTVPASNLGSATSCSLAFSGATVYASFLSSDGPFLRSDDGGETFVRIPVPFGGATLAIDLDGSLLAATATGVLRSRDGGVTWNAAFPTPAPCPFVTPVMVVDHVGGLDYVVCGPVFRSGDRGASWTPLADAGAPVSRLVVDPVRPSLIYVSTNPEDLSSIDHVLVSGDAGNSWRDLDFPLSPGVNDLALSPDGVRLYAATGAGIYERGLRRPVSVSPRP